eukprot:g4674.t1
MDRFPNKEILDRARSLKNEVKLYICFGGNGRSNGFKLVLDENKRKVFLKELISLVEKYDLDGIDYNWEYPGYSFQHGYSNKKIVDDDYRGLRNLVKETREIFDGYTTTTKTNKRLGITLAYYPDGRQEKLFLTFNVSKYVDYMHMMTYDQHGKQHSSYAFAATSINQAIDMGLPPEKLTLGLPFYGRDNAGRWTTYEDILGKYYNKIRGSDGKMNVDTVSGIGFNSVEMIGKKTQYAINKNIGGVMIWEIGQDCRMKEVKELNGNVHVETCRGNAAENSLHVAISNMVEIARNKKWKLEAARDAGEL